VAFDPLEADGEGGAEIEEFGPEVGVEGRLSVGFDPAFFPPAFGPPFGDAVDHIGGVGGDDDGACGGADMLQALDAPHELHAVVGGVAVAALEFGALFAIDDHHAVAAGTGVSDGTAVTEDVKVFSVGLGARGGGSGGFFFGFASLSDHLTVRGVLAPGFGLFPGWEAFVHGPFKAHDLGLSVRPVGVNAGHTAYGDGIKFR